METVETKDYDSERIVLGVRIYVKKRLKGDLLLHKVKLTDKVRYI